MKPKTALQKKVVELSGKLPIITDKQKQYAIDKSFENWAVVSRNKLFCLECGDSWKEGKGIISSNSEDKRKCPSCNKWLKMFRYNETTFKEIEYFGILTTIENYQVVRIISATKFMKKSEKPTYRISEVMQHFIDEKGIMTTMSKSVQMMSRAYDQWVFFSELEIRGGTYNDNLRANLNPWKVYPNRKILPIIKRNGFKGNFHTIAPQNLFKAILSNSTAEYLLKSNQINALDYCMSSSHFDKYLPSVKICNRNSYQIKNFSDWKDYIDLLIYFGKDLHNAKYVCPDDLNKEHDKLVLKKRAIEKLQKLEDNKKKIAKSQKLYSKQKKAFFGLQFSDNNITIRVIESIKDFLEEGDDLGHCVFSNEYYKRADSLVLSAMVGEKRIETVEISLSKLKIQQSRGEKNKASQYNEEIINLVNKNMHKISAIVKQAS